MRKDSSRNLGLKKIVSKRHGAKSRKSYRKPRLNELGDLRGLTLGHTFGRGESGALDQIHKNHFEI